MSTRRRPHRFDLSFGPGHGPVSGVLNAAAAMYALTMWLYNGHGSAWWGLTAGVTMATAGVLVARAYQQPVKAQLFRAGCWGGAGCWSGWTLSGFQGIPVPFTDNFRLLTMLSSPGNPWAWKPFYAMVIGTAVAGMIGWRMVVEHQRALAAAERLALEAAENAARIEAERLAARVPVHEEEGIGWEWQAILNRIITGKGTRKPLEVVGVKKWEPFYGFTLGVVLPDDGTVLKDVKSYEEALASAADLPEGCGVEITGNPGMGRRNILIKVTTGTALADDIPAPPAAPDTVENPQAFGVSGEGTVVEADLRYSCLTLVGQVDSGKSNQIHALIKSLSQCTDVVLIGIDVTGNGRAFRPWNRPYFDGRASRPVFTLIAPNQHYARLFAASLLNLINGRTADYADLMHAEGTDKIMVRPELPQVAVIVDEFGALDDDIKEMLGQVADTGRGAGVRGVFCALEATGTYLPTNIIRQSRVRMAMRVTDEAQLQYLFDATWSRGRFDPASMPWKGSGLWADGPIAPAKFKGYRVDPARIDAHAVEVADWRPDLDDLSLQRVDTVSISVKTEFGREDRVFTGVWTHAEDETYPLIFPAKKTAAMAAAGLLGGGSAQSSTTSTEGTPMQPNSSSPGSASDAAKAMNDAVGGMNSALADLEAAADKAQQEYDAGKQAAGDGEPGDGDPSGMSAAQLSAIFDAGTAGPEHGYGGTPPADPPADPPTTPPAPGQVTHQNTQNKPHPRRRTLQIVAESAQAGGIGATGIAEQLAREGYSTDRATVQGWLSRFRAEEKVDQPGGKGTPYVPGPKLGDPYQP